MKLKQLIEQLNQLAKERPEALEMEVCNSDSYGWNNVNSIGIDKESFTGKEVIKIYPY